MYLGSHLWVKKYKSFVLSPTPACSSSGDEKEVLLVQMSNGIAFLLGLYCLCNLWNIDVIQLGLYENLTLDWGKTFFQWIFVQNLFVKSLDVLEEQIANLSGIPSRLILVKTAKTCEAWKISIAMHCLFTCTIIVSQSICCHTYLVLLCHTFMLPHSSLYF